MSGSPTIHPEQTCILEALSHGDGLPCCSDRNALCLVLPCLNRHSHLLHSRQFSQKYDRKSPSKKPAAFHRVALRRPAAIGPRPTRSLHEFHLSPGEHSFTVPWHSTRPGKDQLLINVERGGQHCVRLSAKMTNFELIPMNGSTVRSKKFPVSRRRAKPHT